LYPQPFSGDATEEFSSTEAGVEKWRPIIKAGSAAIGGCEGLGEAFSDEAV
jgi:hypothetical protein